MTETLRPGGGVARRALHFIVIADCSGSMKGEDRQALAQTLMHPPAGPAPGALDDSIL